MSAPSGDAAVRDLLDRLLSTLGAAADAVDERTVMIEWGGTLLRITIDVVDDDGHLLP